MNQTSPVNFPLWASAAEGNRAQSVRQRASLTRENSLSLGRGGETERWLAEIEGRHLPNESHDAFLPFAADLLQIWVVLLEAFAHFHLQRIGLVAENVDRRADR